VGTKSFSLEHQIWSGERLVADAKSVLVGYDYEAGTSVPLTANQRRRLTE
jgi:acyl-CoA thioesterase FadM